MAFLPRLRATVAALHLAALALAPSPLAAQASTTLVNYDFVPGARLLFAEDFATDTLGDFPRRLELIKGNADVVTIDGRRWLRAMNELSFALPLPETLPTRFTLELDLMAPEDAEGMIAFAPGGIEAYQEGAPIAQFIRDTGAGEAGLSFEDGRNAKATLPEIGRLFTIRVMADGPYTKMYVNGTRVSNAPNFDLGRSRKIHVYLSENMAGFAGIYVGAVRIAAGGRDLYDALRTDGRVAVHGVLFDTGSDRIRPESTPTLAAIAEVMQRDPVLRMKIEGHTDSVGDDAANQALSTARAAAVRGWLVSRHGIAADRLVSEGLGETKPAGPNDTAEGRQQNRRVELVRL